MADYAIELDAVTKKFGDSQALRGVTFSHPGRLGARRTGPQRGGQDHHDQHPVHPDPAVHRARDRGGVRRGEAGQAGSRRHRPHRPVRRRRRIAHRPREPDPVRAAARHEAPPGQRTCRRDARGVQPHRRRRQAGVHLLRWHAAPRRHRLRSGRAAEGGVPRRADHRAGSAQPPRGVGPDRIAEGPRHHGAAHHAVPRGGRRLERLHRRHRPRQGDRRRHPRGTQEQGRRQLLPGDACRPHRRARHRGRAGGNRWSGDRHGQRHGGRARARRRRHAVRGVPSRRRTRRRTQRHLPAQAIVGRGVLQADRRRPRRRTPWHDGTRRTDREVGARHRARRRPDLRDRRSHRVLRLLQHHAAQRHRHRRHQLPAVHPARHRRAGDDLHRHDDGRPRRARSPERHGSSATHPADVGAGSGERPHAVGADPRHRRTGRGRRHRLRVRLPVQRRHRADRRSRRSR